MKYSLRYMLVVSILVSMLPTTTVALDLRQMAANKLESAQKTLATMQQNVEDFGNCVLKGNCSSDKQKQLSSALKGSAAAVGTAIVALVAAGAVSLIAGAPTSNVQPANLAQPSTNDPTISQSDKNISKFLAAILTHNKDLAQEMLQQGVNVDTQFQYVGGFTALTLAAREGDGEMVEFLLKRGATPIIPEQIEKSLTPDIKRIIAIHMATGGRGKTTVTPQGQNR